MIALASVMETQYFIHSISNIKLLSSSSSARLKLDFDLSASFRYISFNRTNKPNNQWYVQPLTSYQNQSTRNTHYLFQFILLYE